MQLKPNVFWPSSWMQCSRTLTYAHGWIFNGFKKKSVKFHWFAALTDARGCSRTLADGFLMNFKINSLKFNWFAILTDAHGRSQNIYFHTPCPYYHNTWVRQMHVLQWKIVYLLDDFINLTNASKTSQKKIGGRFVCAIDLERMKCNVREQLRKPTNPKNNLKKCDQ